VGALRISSARTLLELMTVEEFDAFLAGELQLEDLYDRVYRRYCGGGVGD